MQPGAAARGDAAFPERLAAQAGAPAGRRANGPWKFDGARSQGARRQALAEIATAKRPSKALDENR